MKPVHSGFFYFSFFLHLFPVGGGGSTTVPSLFGGERSGQPTTWKRSHPRKRPWQPYRKSWKPKDWAHISHSTLPEITSSNCDSMENLKTKRLSSHLIFNVAWDHKSNCDSNTAIFFFFLFCKIEMVWTYPMQPNNGTNEGNHFYASWWLVKINGKQKKVCIEAW